MTTLTSMLSLILGAIILIGFSSFAWLSLREGKRRATRIALLTAIVGSLPFFLSLLLPDIIRWVLLGLFACTFVVALILFFIPIGRTEFGDDVPKTRYDERDIPFARSRLDPNSPEYEDYYAMRPEKKAVDEKIRSLPGLFSPHARNANPSVFAVAKASFSLTEALREEVDGPVSPTLVEKTPETNSAYIKNFALYLGAVTVGVTELHPYHLYSHVGRGSGEYGSPVLLNHRYALAFTVEMDHRIVGVAPQAPLVMESAHQYAEVAKIALILAYFIRSQGYPARAHIDGNYRVIAPLVARDAGLGEIGRIGILMTPELGPRVRLGVVTTDLPLIPDQRSYDTSMLDFCRICKKCAQNCPSRSIPFGDRQEINGTLRWRIHADTCFHYWNVIGTDCGICKAVCPYSHPDTPLHNAVRWAVRRSGFMRRVSLWLDDAFYGRELTQLPAPEWIPH
jgi:ferredoxin